jgi:hypothetical protein
MIYKLTAILDDPRFGGFEGNSDLFDSIPTERNSLDFQVARKKEGWLAPTVYGYVRSINHYPCINLAIPAFSSHAAGVLGDFLGRNGELLPIRTSCGEFYFYNLLSIADVLDTERSTLSWSSKPIRAGFIKNYEFFAGRMQDLEIFRIPQAPLGIYVTDAFVSAAMKASLSGLRFHKIWPLPPSPRGYSTGWPQNVDLFPRLETPVKPPETMQNVAETADEAMRESVRLDLKTDASSNNPNYYHKLKEDLSRFLEPADPRAFAVGHLEYIDSEEEFDLLMFSCPHAAPLAAALRDFFHHRGAPVLKIIKRAGCFDDAEATEELA